MCLMQAQDDKIRRHTHLSTTADAGEAEGSMQGLGRKKRT